MSLILNINPHLVNIMVNSLYACFLSVGQALRTSVVLCC